MSSTSEASITLQALTRPELIYPDLAGTDRASILRELAGRLAASGIVDDAERLYLLLQEREGIGSTGIGAGVAVPHCKLKGLDGVVLAIGLAAQPIEFESTDGERVRAFFVVLSPPGKPAAHLQSLAAISRWVKSNSTVEKIFDRSEPEAIYELLLQEETAA